jgi:broad specificity phosphatase PhoE
LPDLVRGSEEIPLSPEGIQLAKERGIQFKRTGGICSLVSSSLQRAIDTSRCVLQSNPGVRMKVAGELQTQGFGALEGRPQKDCAKLIRSLVVDYPDRKPPSDYARHREGESFNSFKRRVIEFMKPQLQFYLMDPNHRPLWVTHNGVCRLINAWAYKGFPQNFEVDRNHYMQEGHCKTPAEVQVLTATNIRKEPMGLWADWHLKSVNMSSLAKRPYGIYMMRHSFTDWND